MNRVSVLRAFFYREGKDTLTSFMQEIKALSKDERAELATLAAKEMNVVLTEE